jgi:LysM repeat protein
MRIKSTLKPLRFISFLLSAFVLFGCQLLNQPNDGNIQVDDLQLQSRSYQDQAIELAITQLEQGKNQQASEVIERVLRANKQHATANLLKQLIDVPASEFFNTTRLTNYSIKSGDTLGSIAKTWLGNSLYFVSLAQLNEIEKPTLIKPGQTLKIPVIAIGPLIQKEIRRSNANLSLIDKLTAENKYLLALEKINSLFIREQQYDQLSNKLSQALEQLAKASVSISDRYQMIEKVSQIAPQNRRPNLTAIYHSFIAHQSHQVLLDEFLLLLEDQSYLQSANKLLQAREKLANSEQLDSASEKINLLVDKLHAEAIIFRKNQQLVQAMRRWEKILEIDPSNQLAKKYLARTSKLLSKLKQLN